uniref:SFRICE_007634 n=1 Tax=Spodoptera frugiperda TaxID=7108 RepID=A0A2H1WQP4_SPOFR
MWVRSTFDSSELSTRPEKQLSALASGPPPPAPIVPRSADGPRPPGWNGQPRRHGSSRFNVHNHNQELVKLPPIKDKVISAQSSYE